MKTPNCNYPECMLCCCEEGKNCPHTEPQKSPVKQLLKGIVVGLILTVLLIAAVATIVTVWPTYYIDIIACSALALLLTLLWLWNQ